MERKNSRKRSGEVTPSGCKRLVRDSDRNAAEGKTLREGRQHFLTIDRALHADLAGPRPLGDGQEVFLQGFNWESAKQGSGPSWYEVLKGRIQLFVSCGITAIWLPPPSDSVSIQGYMPRSLEVLTSSYGQEAELRSLIHALHEAKIKVLADIVVNHRCAAAKGDDGKWNKFTGLYDWDAVAICCDNPDFGGTGGHKEGEDFTAAPNLDHNCQRVKQDLTSWLHYLTSDIRFDGWRFDFVKGYAGWHVRDFIQATSPKLAVGEFWDTCAYDEEGILKPDQDDHRQRTIDWCDQTSGTSAAFDFTTKAVLQEALAKQEFWRLRDSQGHPPGVLGWWPQRAVAFLDNHDTGSTQAHWPFPAQFLRQGYCYIMTHPCTPCVFIDHLDEQQDDMLCQGQGTSLLSCIQQFAALRKRMRISDMSEVVIEEAAEVYAAVIDDKVAVKMGAGDWEPSAPTSGHWTVALSGQDWAVWELTT